MYQVDESEDACLGSGKVCCSRDWEGRNPGKTCSMVTIRDTKHKEEMGYCCEGVYCGKVDDNTGAGICVTDVVDVCVAHGAKCDVAENVLVVFKIYFRNVLYNMQLREYV